MRERRETIVAHCPCTCGAAHGKQVAKEKCAYCVIYERLSQETTEHGEQDSTNGGPERKGD